MASASLSRDEDLETSAPANCTHVHPVDSVSVTASARLEREKGATASAGLVSVDAQILLLEVRKPLVEAWAWKVAVLGGGCQHGRRACSAAVAAWNSMTGMTERARIGTARVQGGGRGREPAPAYIDR